MLAEIRAAGKPACGHNMLFDLVFVLNIFGGDYPTWSEFKKACELFFPAGIYDTKHVFKGVEKRTGRLLPSNHLGDVYAAMKAPEVSTDADAATQALVRAVLQKARDESGAPDGCAPTSPFLCPSFMPCTFLCRPVFSPLDPCTLCCALLVEMHSIHTCLLYTSPSPRDRQKSRMPSSA